MSYRLGYFYPIPEFNIYIQGRFSGSTCSLSQPLSAGGLTCSDGLYSVSRADSFLFFASSVTPRVAATGLHSGSLELAPLNASSSSSLSQFLLKCDFCQGHSLTGRPGCMNGGLWAEPAFCIADVIEQLSWLFLEDSPLTVLQWLFLCFLLGFPYKEPSHVLDVHGSVLSSDVVTSATVLCVARSRCPDRYLSFAWPPLADLCSKSLLF